MSDVITESTILPTPIEPTISGLVDPPEPEAAEPVLPLAAHDGEKAQLIQNAEHAYAQLEKWVEGNLPENEHKDDTIRNLRESFEDAVYSIKAG